MKRESSAAALTLAATREVLAGRKVSPRGFETREVGGWLGELTDPLARCCALPERKWDPSFCLAEWLWYMRGSDRVGEIAFWAPQYSRYSDDGKQLRGAYGPRVFRRCPALKEAAAKLVADRDTRQAVVAVYENGDLFVESRDVPCTLSWAFNVRDGLLEMNVIMRSNDVFTGFPNDVFAFTMIQEVVAKWVGMGLGTYRHFSVSMHAYARNYDRLNAYLEASSKTPVPELKMLPMPPSDFGFREGELGSGGELAECLDSLQRFETQCRLSRFESVGDAFRAVSSHGCDQWEWGSSIAWCLAAGSVFRRGSDLAFLMVENIADDSLRHAMALRVGDRGDAR